MLWQYSAQEQLLPKAKIIMVTERSKQPHIKNGMK